MPEDKTTIITLPFLNHNIYSGKNYKLYH